MLVVFSSTQLIIYLLYLDELPFGVYLEIPTFPASFSNRGFIQADPGLCLWLAGCTLPLFHGWMMSPDMSFFSLIQGDVKNALDSSGPIPQSRIAALRFGAKADPFRRVLWRSVERERKAMRGVCTRQDPEWRYWRHWRLKIVSFPDWNIQGSPGYLGYGEVMDLVVVKAERVSSESVHIGRYQDRDAVWIFHLGCPI